MVVGLAALDPPFARRPCHTPGSKANWGAWETIMRFESFVQKDVLTDLGLPNSEGICWALSLNWIRIHRDKKIGSTEEKQKHRMSEVRKVAQRAVSIQNEYAFCKTEIAPTLGGDAKFSLCAVLIQHFGKDLKLSFDMTNPATAKCVWQPGNAKLTLDDFADHLCSIPDSYNMLDFYYKDGTAHAMATYNGGSWWVPDTVLFNSNVGDLDEINKTFMKSWLNSHNINQPIALVLALRVAAN